MTQTTTVQTSVAPPVPRRSDEKEAPQTSNSAPHVDLHVALGAMSKRVADFESKFLRQLRIIPVTDTNLALGRRMVEKLVAKKKAFKKYQNLPGGLACTSEEDPKDVLQNYNVTMKDRGITVEKSTELLRLYDKSQSSLKARWERFLYSTLLRRNL